MKKPKLSPNSILNCTLEEYHNDPCDVPSLSSSSAHTLITKSPMHCWMEHPRFGNQRREPTEAMDNGTLIHCLLLGKGREIVGLHFDDWRKNEAKKQREEILAAGMMPVLRHKLDESMDAAEIIRQRLLAFDIDFMAPGSTNEVAMQFEEENGVRCRMRVDHFHYDDALILDLKTSRSAHPRSIQSHMINYGMDIQHAAYASGVSKLYPDLEGRLQMGFVFVECEPPYAVLPVIPIGTMKELGRRKWNRAIELWKRCIETNTWPSYSDSVYYVDAPIWALQEESNYGSEIENI